MFILSYAYGNTSIHFFCDCKFSINIWSELEKWILANTGYKINFTKENILFGFQGANNKAMNCLTFIIKRTLYNNTLQNKVPYFPQVKISLINYYKKEKYIAETNCLYGNLKKKLMSLKRLFDKQIWIYMQESFNRTFFISIWTVMLNFQGCSVVFCIYTVEHLYNEVLGTMKIALLYRVSPLIYQDKKQRNMGSWSQQNNLVMVGFCCIRPLCNGVPL